MMNDETDGWHPWTGGSIDLAQVRVAVRWRSGNEWVGNTHDFQWHWRAEEQPHDIIAYKVLTPPPIDPNNLRQH